jgi:hypothetical protein
MNKVHLTALFKKFPRSAAVAHLNRSGFVASHPHSFRVVCCTNLAYPANNAQSFMNTKLIHSKILSPFGILLCLDTSNFILKILSIVDS